MTVLNLAWFRVHPPPLRREIKRKFRSILSIA
jgi:hypothetical protein